MSLNFPASAYISSISAPTLDRRIDGNAVITERAILKLLQRVVAAKRSYVSS